MPRSRSALGESLSLLHRLDAIQSGDPMIREGRRSISKELSRILDFVDKVLMKEHRLPPEAEQIEEANANGERALLEDSGRRAKSKEGSTKNSARKVRFFEEAMRSEAALFGRHEPAIGDSDENDLVKSLARELTGAGASRGLTESNEFYQISDDEENSEDSAPEGTEGEHANSKGKHFQLRSGKSGLAAPMPMQMEAREV